MKKDLPKDGASGAGRIQSIEGKEMNIQWKGAFKHSIRQGRTI